MTLNLNKDEEDPSTSYALKSQTKFNRNETEKTFGNDTSKRSPKKDVKFLETPVYKNQYPILAKANKEKFKIAPKVEKVEPIPIIAIDPPKVEGITLGTQITQGSQKNVSLMDVGCSTSERDLMDTTLREDKNVQTI